MTAPAAAAAAFWRFSLLVYGRPRVADSLIRLQEEGGHNVNLILFALWLGACEGTRLSEAGVTRAKRAIDGIDRAVVAPLRQLRRALKADPAPDVREMRRRILALEIAAERRVQARLVATLAPRRKPRSVGRGAIAEANLRLVLGGDFDPETAALLFREIAAV